MTDITISENILCSVCLREKPRTGSKIISSVESGPAQASYASQAIICADCLPKPKVFPPYKENEPCSKCAALPDCIRTRYCPGSLVIEQGDCVGLDPARREHLHRHCVRCGYTWYEECAKPAVAITSSLTADAILGAETVGEFTADACIAEPAPAVAEDRLAISEDQSTDTVL